MNYELDYGRRLQKCSMANVKCFFSFSPFSGVCVCVFPSVISKCVEGRTNAPSHVKIKTPQSTPDK